MSKEALKPEIILKFDQTEKCIGIVNYRDDVIIATDRHIYKYNGDTFGMIELVNGENGCDRQNPRVDL